MEDVPAQRICVPSHLAIDPGLACGSGEQQSLEHFGVGGGGGAGKEGIWTWEKPWDLGGAPPFGSFLLFPFKT